MSSALTNVRLTCKPYRTAYVVSPSHKSVLPLIRSPAFLLFFSSIPATSATSLQ